MIGCRRSWNANCARWLGVEPDPHDLLISFPAERMRMGLISNRVNSPHNDDPFLLDPVPEVSRGRTAPLLHSGTDQQPNALCYSDNVRENFDALRGHYKYNIRALVGTGQRRAERWRCQPIRSGPETGLPRRSKTVCSRSEAKETWTSKDVRSGSTVPKDQVSFQRPPVQGWRTLGGRISSTAGPGGW